MTTSRQALRDWIPAGAALLFPLAALLSPEPWRIDTTLPVASLQRVVIADAGRHPEPVTLPASDALALREQEWLEFRFAEPAAALAVELRARPGSFLRLGVSGDGRSWTPLWTASTRPGVDGPSLLRSPLFHVDPAVSHLRVRAAQGSAVGLFAVDVRSPLFTLDPRVVAVAIWIAIALLRLLGSESRAANVLRAARAIDPIAAPLLVYATLFHAPPPLLPATLVFAACCTVVWMLRRAPVTTLGVVAACGIAAVVVPPLVENWIISKIAEVHELDVDHRLKPDGDEINEDGIRFRGSAEDLREDDFVVLFLGDSFTYGAYLAYEDALPYAFERVLADASCSARIRAVDTGWPSASPLLSLRLLREIGARYRPDLVVLALDMTDFHDDLRYERKLRDSGDFDLDRREIVGDLLSRALPRFAQRTARAMADLLRTSAATDAAVFVDVPTDRWFATNAPLEATRAEFERGVMRNLEAIREFAATSLGAPFALVVYPRAFQYSNREATESWENERYTALGPYVREPFRYFEEKRDELAYPVVDLLPHFENASEFPLFLADDPHWSAAGSQLAARSTATELLRLGLLPCGEVVISREDR